MLSNTSRYSALIRKAAVCAANTTGSITSIKAAASVHHQSIRQFAVAPPKKNDDVAKVKTKKGPVKTNIKKKGGREDSSQSDAIYKFLTAAEDARKVKLEFTEEELATNKQIARTYQSECAKHNAELHKDLALKARLIEDALKAMPPKLREHAVIIDETIPPTDRPWARYDTPPIKGFNPLDYIDKKKK